MTQLDIQNRKDRVAMVQQLIKMEMYWKWKGGNQNGKMK